MLRAQIVSSLHRDRSVTRLQQQHPRQNACYRDCEQLGTSFTLDNAKGLPFSDKIPRAGRPSKYMPGRSH